MARYIIAYVRVCVCACVCVCVFVRKPHPSPQYNLNMKLFRCKLQSFVFVFRFRFRFRFVLFLNSHFIFASAPFQVFPHRHRKIDDCCMYYVSFSYISPQYIHMILMCEIQHR